MKSAKVRSAPKEVIQEMYGGEPYEYYPLGKYVVAAPGVCGGRPTFKYTRLEVAFVLDLLAAGWSIEKVTHEYADSRLSAAAVKEAIRLAKEALVKSSAVLQPAT